MKKLKTIILLLAVAGLGYFAYTLTNKGGNSNLADEALSDFSVKDTASIDRLFFSDTKGNKGFSVVRTPNGWINEDGSCVQQHLIIQMLECIKHIAVKSPVPANSVDNINKQLTSTHKKMEIYVKGEIAKTWYIGNPTADHYGTYMLLKDPVKGKSPEPFIMHLPSMFGNLESRFISDPRQLECTGIFNYDPLEIASIQVTQPDSAKNNFKITALDKNKFSLTSNEFKVEKFDTARVRDYLLVFRKVHFEQHNYLIDQHSADSLKRETPQWKVEVIDKNGQSKKIACYKKRMTYEKYDFEGNLIEYDRDRLWVVLQDGRLVVGQYYVFDHVLRDLNYFTERLISQ